jgi:hypothetical protein
LLLGRCRSGSRCGTVAAQNAARGGDDAITHQTPRPTAIGSYAGKASSSTDASSVRERRVELVEECNRTAQRDVVMSIRFPGVLA